jgi:methyl-accepting chemotaxis protein
MHVCKGGDMTIRSKLIINNLLACLIIMILVATSWFNDVVNNFNVVMMVMGVISFVLLSVMAVWVITSILKPLNALKDLLEDIAQGEGDLTRRLNAASRDELGEISRSFNQFIDKLRGIIFQVAQTAGHVSAASSQLHSTADQIATGAEQVATQTGSVATASEEMSATASDIARTCLLAAEASNQTQTAANESAYIVMESVNVMNTIAECVQHSAQTVGGLGQRSDQIGAIVSTIEDIADQTNLLALNAAIEAARAGEQGRGFAVVADEVRALAERTTKATREISEMIKAIQQETKGAVISMENGVREVETGISESARSSESLCLILTQVAALTEQVSQIATAAEQQTATTGEITRNLQQVTDVVLDTARGASETASASSELARQAGELQNLVAQFKLS